MTVWTDQRYEALIWRLLNDLARASGVTPEQLATRYRLPCTLMEATPWRTPRT